MTPPTDADDAGRRDPDPAPGAGEGFRDLPAPFRWAAYLLLVLLVLGVAATAGGWWVARRSLPQTDGTLHLPGLDGSVAVRRDARGVPQVYADTTHDLFAAQGFVQAQDRFWQMDHRRHAASGQLAEILGPRLVGRDEVARTLGWRRTAQAELPLLDASTREALRAFSDGVNAYLARHLGSDNSLEYTVVSLHADYRPADWTPVDSLAYLKMAAWQRSGNLHEEVQRAALAASPPPAGAASLYPAYALGRHAPVTGGRVPGSGARPQPTFSYAGERPDAPGLLDQVGEDIAAEDPVTSARTGTDGSAWAVAGRLSVSGEPLLAGVPGQDVGLPGAAYQSGLHCRRVTADCPYDVSGVAAPGLPGILEGRTTDVAWSLTGLGADTTDLYLEDVGAGTSLQDGRRVPLTTRTERIRVAGRASRQITVRSTRHGPLLSDVSATVREVGRTVPVPDGSPDRGRGYAVAVRWQGSTPRPSADALLALDRAHSVDDVRTAARSLAAPTAGVVYVVADGGGGSIGYQAAGAVPEHAEGEGVGPQPGWSAGSTDAPALEPFDRLPHEEDPSSGVVVAAGQPPSADVTTLGDDWDYGARADRVRALLRARSAGGRRLRATDLTAVAADTRSPTAAVLVPYLRAVRLRSAYERQGQSLLAGWDGAQPAGSAAAAFYDVVWRNLLALTFHDQLPPRLWPDGDSRWDQVVADLLTRPDDAWWDDASTERREDRDEVLARAMGAARDEMTRLVARDPDRWSWGRLHRLDLDRPDLGATWLGARLFDRDGPPAPGGPGAVLETVFDPRRGYAVTAAPAARLVSDLADPDKSRWVVLGGTSGHVLGPHDTDQLDAWLRGATYPWPGTPAGLRAAARTTLTLR